MHPWNLSENDAIMLQKSLASDCILEGHPEISTVAGVDMSVYPDSRIGIAASVLYSSSNKEVRDEVVLIGDLSFPYKPGLLAFREAPLMIGAVMKLEEEPDCLLVDGHGYAHPRRFGLASHLGLLLDIPSIGIAKRILVGNYDEPDEEVGSYTDLWDGEPIGYAYRSLSGANPIFLSPGHRVGLREIPDIIQSFVSERTRLPTPLHRTDKLASGIRRQLEDISGVFADDSPVFLVGGCLRDLLLGKPPRDYDLLVTKFEKSTREHMAEKFSGSVFPLDEERSIYRLNSEDLSVDVTIIEEDQVIDDLVRRDFTINSIALDLTQESWIDPTGGREDADERILRPSSDESLESDPLRILRGYRLGQYHDLSFSDELSCQIGQSAEQLVEVSRERIVEELLKMVSGPEPELWFRRMEEDHLFDRISFLRVLGIEELGVTENWCQELLSKDTILSKTVHGNYVVLKGFEVGRLIQKPGVFDWPFHRMIKVVLEASYRGLGNEVSYEVMTLSKVRLCGRLLGRALNERWSKERIGESITHLQDFLRKRKEMEHDIVDSIDMQDEIAQMKERKLRETLPDLWEQSMDFER